jgi:hypothetical protein
MANEITTSANSVWRDYATDGVPSSGAHEPAKSDIRTHAATVQTQVDAALALAATGVLVKDAVRVATTANGTLASGFENGDTIDGIVLATSDRILIKGQSTGAENGIYVVAASGAPTRATDANEDAELPGARVYVQEGTANGGTSWQCSNTSVTLGTTALTFSLVGDESSVVSTVNTAVALAEQWAEEVEDTPVTGSQYSALHWAAKAASESASAAAAAGTAVATSNQVILDVPQLVDIWGNFQGGFYYNVGNAYKDDIISWCEAVGSGEFTRSTTATYIDSAGLVATAAIDTPRVTYNPTTLAVRGLLYEPAVTNLVRYSQDITNSVWKFSNPGTTSTGNSTASPSGVTDAGKLQEDSSTGEHRLFFYDSGAGIVSGTTYTLSLWVKAAGRTKFSLSPVGTSGLSLTGIDLTAETSSNADFSLEEYPSGWWRIAATKEATGTGVYSFTLNLDNDSGTSYTGDGSSGVYIWGLQLEASSAATSYIPTTSAQVAKTADLLKIDLPTDVTDVTYIFDDSSTQVESVTGGTLYSMITALDRPTIGKFVSVDYVAGEGAAVTSVAGKAGAVTLVQADVGGLTPSDSPTFTNATLSGTTLNIDSGKVKLDSSRFEWVSSGPATSGAWRAIIIGGNILEGVTSFSNSVAIGIDLAGSATTFQTAVVIGDTAAGLVTTLSNSNVIGNEAGNGPTTIASSDIIGNLAKVGSSGTASRVTAMGFQNLRYNSGTDTISVGANAGLGISGNEGVITQSVLLGSSAGADSGGATITNLILIGYDVQAPAPTTANYLNIGNALKGSMSTGDYTLTTSAGGNAELEVAGLKLTNLLTSDPAELGKIWSDGGTLKVSAG